MIDVMTLAINHASGIFITTNIILLSANSSFLILLITNMSADNKSKLQEHPIPMQSLGMANENGTNTATGEIVVTVVEEKEIVRKIDLQ
jgi:hypothetical protein